MWIFAQEVEKRGPLGKRGVKRAQERLTGEIG